MRASAEDKQHHTSVVGHINEQLCHVRILESLKRIHGIRLEPDKVIRE
jgi:hypothetical protein